MRYSTDHKERSREKILREASILLRERGVDGVGVAEIMAKAGMTHGGFYAHFANRDAMVADALSAALDATFERLRGLVAERPPEARLATLVRAYLGRYHLEHPGDGCCFAALGSEIHRLPVETRQMLGRHYRRLAGLLAGALADAGRRREEAPMVLACMVGTLTMARAADDPQAGERLLAEARRHLLS